MSKTDGPRAHLVKLLVALSNQVGSYKSGGRWVATGRVRHKIGTQLNRTVSCTEVKTREVRVTSHARRHR